MDTLEDSNLKNVWVYHFSKREGSLASRLALINLRMIIKGRATAADAEMAAAVQRYGIPAEEWSKFHEELIAPNDKAGQS